MEKNAALAANSTSADKSSGANNTNSYEMPSSTFNETTITYDDQYDDTNYYDLKDQQAQYQQVFQKHATGPSVSSSIPVDSFGNSPFGGKPVVSSGRDDNAYNSNFDDVDDLYTRKKRRSSQDEGSSKFELMYSN